MVASSAQPNPVARPHPQRGAGRCASALRRAVPVFIATLLGPVTAFATVEGDASDAAQMLDVVSALQACESDTADVQSQIEACTRLIRTEELEDSILVIAYIDRGYAYVTQDDYPSALDDFNRALALKPDEVDALDGRGLVYTDYLHDYDKAIDDFSAALAIEPNDMGAHYLRATAYHALGTAEALDAAIADLTRNIAIDPSLTNYGYLPRGTLYAESGDYDRAAEDFQKCLSIDPNNIDCAKGMANVRP
jgi:tetratricopeptide (TPR) repeat protein